MVNQQVADFGKIGYKRYVENNRYNNLEKEAKKLELLDEIRRLNPDYYIELTDDEKGFFVMPKAIINGKEKKK